MGWRDGNNIGIEIGIEIEKGDGNNEDKEIGKGK